MTTLTMALLLAWRDPARQVALMFGACSMLFWFVAPASDKLWACCFIAPAFFLSVALTVPSFSAFELSLPVTVTHLLWSRIVVSLAILWTPLLAGSALRLYEAEDVRQTIECALLFTASACLLTLARLAPRRVSEWTFAILAAVCGVLTLHYFTRPMASAVACAAALPVAGRLWWTYVPDEQSAVERPVVGRPIWPFLRLTVPWRMLALLAPLAFFIGTNQMWSSLMFLLPILLMDSQELRYCQPLPIARRYVLLGRLAPVVLALLVGAFWPMGAEGSLSADRMLSSELRSGSSDWRRFTGQALGISVPLDYYTSCPAKNPPPIVSPWGEIARPSARWVSALSGTRKSVCNPFWVSPQNSDRFFEWQFARATRTIYGKPLRPAELAAAVGAGLQPALRQTRMRIFDAAFATAGLLLIALLANAHAIPTIPNGLRLLLQPFVIPVAIVFALPMFFPQQSELYDPIAGHMQPLLIRLSDALPANLLLTATILLAALAPLYCSVEILFNGVEFPENPKETA